MSAGTPGSVAFLAIPLDSVPSFGSLVSEVSLLDVNTNDSSQKSLPNLRDSLAVSSEIKDPVPEASTDSFIPFTFAL